jgi:hypothetical protein
MVGIGLQFPAEVAEVEIWREKSFLNVSRHVALVTRWVMGVTYWIRLSQFSPTWMRAKWYLVIVCLCYYCAEQLRPLLRFSPPHGVSYQWLPTLAQMLLEKPALWAAEFCLLRFTTTQWVELDSWRLQNRARSRWLMPIILATWEAEIGRIVVPGQPHQEVWETPPLLNQ